MVERPSEIRPNPDNKKFKNIFLTEKAKSLQDKASAYREYTESVIIKDFTPDEKEYRKTFIEFS